VDIYGGSITPALPYVEDGKAKCLLVTSADDNEALPQASGLAALGHPELETVLWRMMLAPEGMDEQRVNVIADAVASAVEHPEFQAFLTSQGETLNLVRGEELRERLHQETVAIGETLEKLGLKKN
jgi:tripartite-type tricarboxylate transporter receptor subunit TctC